MKRSGGSTLKGMEKDKGKNGECLIFCPGAPEFTSYVSVATFSYGALSYHHYHRLLRRSSTQNIELFNYT